MDADVLKSYLVKLGFAIDQSQFSQFEQALKRSAKSVDDHTGLVGKRLQAFSQKWQGLFSNLRKAFASKGPAGNGTQGVLGQIANVFGGASATAKAGGIFKNLGAVTTGLSRFTAVASIAIEVGKLLVKAQVAIVTVFTAVSAAVLGTIERVAMADQKYRLLGLRMFTTKENARALQTSLDALGASMEEVSWDPELRSQFLQLKDDRESNAAKLGGDFDGNMRKFREVRFELIRLKENIADLIRMFANDVLRLFGSDMDGALSKLKGFNEWFMNKMPALAQWLADTFKPVLDATKDIWGELTKALGAFAVLFTNTMALLSGDDSLETQSFDAKKFAEAIATLGDGLATAIKWLAKFANFMTEVEIAIMNVGSWIERLTDKVLRFFGAIPAWARKKLGFSDEQPAAAGSTNPAGVQVSGKIRQGEITDKVIAEALKQGVDPKIALAVGDHESGLQQYDKNGRLMANPESSARGIFQLLKGTASDLHVDRTDTDGNIHGGVKLLKLMLAKYHGDTKTALQAYYEGSGYVDAHLRLNQAMSPRSEQYANAVMAKANQITVGDIHVEVRKDANPQEYARATVQGVQEALGKQNARTIAQLAYGVG